MLTYIVTIFWCIPSPYVFVMNAEAWVIFHAAQLDYHPVLLGLMAAIGQTIGYATMYIFAERIVSHFRRLKHRVDKFDLIRFKSAGVVTLTSASIFSLPPFNVIAVAAGLIRFNPIMFFSISFVGRWIRFTMLGYFPFLLDRIF